MPLSHFLDWCSLSNLRELCNAKQHEMTKICSQGAAPAPPQEELNQETGLGCPQQHSTHVVVHNLLNQLVATSVASLLALLAAKQQCQ